MKEPRKLKMTSLHPNEKINAEKVLNKVSSNFLKIGSLINFKFS